MSPIRPHSPAFDSRSLVSERPTPSTLAKPLVSQAQQDREILANVAALQNHALSPTGRFAASWRHAILRVPQGPEVLRGKALFELGFVESPVRSKQIIDALSVTGIVDEHGSLTRRNFVPYNVAQTMTATLSHSASPLTAKEALGVRSYLEGVELNLQNLGRDIATLPTYIRPFWFFYAGLEPTAQKSYDLARSMRYHHILSLTYLPKQMGDEFERFVQETIETMIVNGIKDKTVLRKRKSQLWRTRDKLMVLPSFQPGAAPPAYSGHPPPYQT